MKASEISFKSTECQCVDMYKDAVMYRVLITDIPDYLCKEWLGYAEGICVENESPAVEMEAILLPNGELDGIEVKYYFDDYVEFDVEDRDLEEMQSLFKKLCESEGAKFPDAYDAESGELMGDGDWEDLVTALGLYSDHPLSVGSIVFYAFYAAPQEHGIKAALVKNLHRRDFLAKETCLNNPMMLTLNYKDFEGRGNSAVAWFYTRSAAETWLYKFIEGNGNDAV